MWRHWRLDRDPFHDPRPRFIPLEEHRSAVGKLLQAIDAGRPLTLLHGAEGVGKSMVLRQALAEARRAERRIVRVEAPLDAGSLWSDLADLLEGRPRALPESAPTAWRRLERAMRVCTLQGRRPVLGVDDWDAAADLGPLRRLGTLGRATVVASLRGEAEPSDAAAIPLVRLAGLTRSDATTYIAGKLVEAGGAGDIFTPRALLRLHAFSRGIIGDLDRLATSAMTKAAERRLEAVSSEVVDAVAVALVGPGEGSHR